MFLLVMRWRSVDVEPHFSRSREERGRGRQELLESQGNGHVTSTGFHGR